MTAPPRTLLVGIGNTFRGDDGVGPVVARGAAQALQSEGWPGSVDVTELADPASLVEVVEVAELVVVVDAMTSGAPAGSLLTIDATIDPLPTDGWAAGGTHALGLAAAVELCRALGRLPDRLMVVGVEVANVSPGTELTPAVAAAVPDAVEAAAAAVRAGIG